MDVSSACLVRDSAGLIASAEMYVKNAILECRYDVE